MLPTNHVVEQINWLKIIYSNIDTYLNKREELQALIVEINPDIICLTEILPKVKGIDFNPCEYNIPGYQAFYGPHRKRGTAIYVKMQLKSSSKEEPLIFHEFEELVWAEVRLKDRDKLLLGCIYRSPNTDEENSNKLLEMLEVVQQLRPTHLLLVGDFNCKINCDTLVAEQGEKKISVDLVELISAQGWTQHVKLDTHVKEGQRSSLLGLVIKTIYD